MLLHQPPSMSIMLNTIATGRKKEEKKEGEGVAFSMDIYVLAGGYGEIRRHIETTTTKK